MTAFERLAVETALRKLFSQRYFSISEIDSILKVTGTVAPARVMNSLRLLHCVDYGEMPRELLEELPQMVAEALRGPLLDLPRLNLTSDPATGRPRLLVHNG